MKFVELVGSGVAGVGVGIVGRIAYLDSGIREIGTRRVSLDLGNKELCGIGIGVGITG